VGGSLFSAAEGVGDGVVVEVPWVGGVDGLGAAVAVDGESGLPEGAEAFAVSVVVAVVVAHVVLTPTPKRMSRTTARMATSRIRSTVTRRSVALP
jgi:hypothetical protein